MDHLAEDQGAEGQIQTIGEDGGTFAGAFRVDSPQVETYMLTCWRSGSILAFDNRVAQFRDTTLMFCEGRHRSDRCAESDKHKIEQQLKDILPADLESSWS